MPAAAASTHRPAELPPAGRRPGGPPGRPAPAPAAHRRSAPGAPHAARAGARARRPQRRADPRRPAAAPPRRPQRTIKAPDPRQRARRTIRARTRPADATASPPASRARRLITTLVVMLLILSAVLVKVGLLQTFEGDALRSAATAAVDAGPAAARPAGLDLRPQRRGAGPVGAGQHDRRQPASRSTDPGRHGGDVRRRSSTSSAERRDELAAAMAGQDRGFVYVARQVDDDARRASSPPSSWPACRSTARTAASLPGGDTGAQRHRAHRHRRHRHRRPREAVRQRAHRQARRADARGRARRPLDRRQRAGRRASRSPGNDIVLTIDRSVQYAAEQALLRRVAELGARGAPGDRDGHEDRRDHRHGVGADQRRRASTRSRRATTRPSTPTSPARSAR